jgi:DivIVA domain-containing protein
MTFTTALRGYDLDEVDDFLDQVVVAIRDLQDEVASSKSKMADLERSADAGGTDESAVGRALVAAQETADRILGDARAESEAVLSTARSEAETYENEQQRLREESDAEMAEHAERVADVRGQLALLATQVADRLDEMDARVAAVLLTGNEDGEDSAGDKPGLDADSSHHTPEDDYDMGDDDYEDDADSSHDSPDDNNTESDSESDDVDSESDSESDDVDSESDSESDDVDSESDSESDDDKFGDAGDSDY